MNGWPTKMKALTHRHIKIQPRLQCNDMILNPNRWHFVTLHYTLYSTHMTTSTLNQWLTDCLSLDRTDCLHWTHSGYRWFLSNHQDSHSHLVLDYTSLRWSSPHRSNCSHGQTCHLSKLLKKEGEKQRRNHCEENSISTNWVCLRSLVQDFATQRLFILMAGTRGAMWRSMRRTCQISLTVCSRHAALPGRPPHSHRSVPAAGQSPGAEWFEAACAQPRAGWTRPPQSPPGLKRDRFNMVSMESGWRVHTTQVFTVQI